MKKKSVKKNPNKKLLLIVGAVVLLALVVFGVGAVIKTDNGITGFKFNPPDDCEVGDAKCDDMSAIGETWAMNCIDVGGTGLWVPTACAPPKYCVISDGEAICQDICSHFNYPLCFNFVGQSKTVITGCSIVDEVPIFNFQSCVDGQVCLDEDEDGNDITPHCGDLIA